VAIAIAMTIGASSPTLAYAGALSGFFQVLAEQPFDTIKVRLQSRALSFDTYAGSSALVRDTWKKEGTRAFFQGVTPRLLTYSAVKASLFSLFERFHEASESPAIAGGVAGGLNTIISCPADVLKSRLQVQIASVQSYRGPMATACSLFQQHGIKVFYKGWTALIARDVPGYAMLYSIYVHGRASTALEVLPTWVIGGAAGVGFYLLTLPIDRAKTMMMTQTLTISDVSSGVPACDKGQSKPIKQRVLSISEAVSEILAKEGAKGLYRGCWPTLLRTFVGQATALTVYEKAQTVLAD